MKREKEKTSLFLLSVLNSSNFPLPPGENTPSFCHHSTLLSLPAAVAHEEHHTNTRETGLSAVQGGKGYKWTW